MRVSQENPTEWSGFIAEVAEGAHLTEREAAALTEDFLSVLAEHVDREVWESLVSLAPVEVSVEWDDTSRERQATTEDFLLEMSDEEQVESGRAAEHARVVAEAMRKRADRRQLDQIARIENEGITALFELVRGEMTTPDAPTPGEAQWIEGTSERGRPEPD